MERDNVFIIFIVIAVVGFLTYEVIPSKYKKLDVSFGGFVNRSLLRFEYEKSPLHTAVYGGTGTGKTHFVRQYLKLYQGQDQDQDQDNQGTCFAGKNIIILCKDDRDWIDTETGEFYTGFNTCDINLTTSENMSKFKDSVIVLDYMGDRLNKDIAYYFTERRHHNIQMIVMCHQPAQIKNTAIALCDNIF